MDSIYQIDALKLGADAAAGHQHRGPNYRPGRCRIVPELWILADSAIATDRYDIANSMAQIAGDVAGLSGDSDFCNRPLPDKCSGFGKPNRRMLV